MVRLVTVTRPKQDSAAQFSEIALNAAQFSDSLFLVIITMVTNPQSFPRLSEIHSMFGANKNGEPPPERRQPVVLVRASRCRRKPRIGFAPVCWQVTAKTVKATTGTGARK